MRRNKSPSCTLIADTDPLRDTTERVADPFGAYRTTKLKGMSNPCDPNTAVRAGAMFQQVLDAACMAEYNLGSIQFPPVTLGRTPA